MRCCGGGGTGAEFLAAGSPGHGRGESLGTGVALRGTVWAGGDADPVPGTVVVAADGTVAALHPAELPEGVRVVDGAWVGPGVVDAHVHLAFGGPEAELAGGLVAVRDLGAPPADARRWRESALPAVSVAGPLLTAPGGYPSTTWGAAGFALAVESPDAARRAVRDLVADGVDLVKVALEPGSGLPVPSLPEVTAVVETAHAAGLKVTAHALRADMVARALDAGVDELCHTPVEPLPPRLVDRVAAAGVPVVSTLQTFFSGGDGRTAAANAAALVAAGVPFVYGTDLGNAGTRPGVDPRELDRLATAGLGPLGALRAATEGAAAAYGMRGVTGRIEVGRPASVVVLSGDPLREPSAWQHPVALVAAGRLVRYPAGG